VCWNITRVSLWLLCNVYFVQSTQRTRLQTRPFVRGINSLLKTGCLRKQKSSGRPLTAEYRIAVYRVYPRCIHRTSVVVKTNFFSFPVAVNNSIKVGPLVFLLEMFVITENIMKHPVLYKDSKKSVKGQARITVKLLLLLLFIFQP